MKTIYCHDWGVYYGLWWVETRDAPKTPTMNGDNLQHPRVMWPRCHGLKLGSPLRACAHTVPGSMHVARGGGGRVGFEKGPLSMHCGKMLSSEDRAVQRQDPYNIVVQKAGIKQMLVRGNMLLF